MAPPDTDQCAVAIVDDDEAVLDSLKFLLEIEGYMVCAYRSAAAYLEAGAPRSSCLIIDQHMPEMTGLELADRLRSEDVGTPILLVTAAPSARIMAEAARLRIDSVLDKPTQKDELLNYVRLYA